MTTEFIVGLVALAAVATLTPEFFIACAAVATLVGGLIWWVAKSSATTGKAILELALANSDIAKMQGEVQQLRDSKVEHSTLIAQVMTSLPKLEDKMDQLYSQVSAQTAAIAGLAASIDRLRNSDQRGERRD